MNIRPTTACGHELGHADDLSSTHLSRSDSPRELPDDIVKIIASHLSSKASRNFALTCKKYHEMAQPSVWKKICMPITELTKVKHVHVKINVNFQNDGKTIQLNLDTKTPIRFIQQLKIPANAEKDYLVEANKLNIPNLKEIRLEAIGTGNKLIQALHYCMRTRTRISSITKIYLNTHNAAHLEKDYRGYMLYLSDPDIFPNLSTLNLAHHLVCGEVTRNMMSLEIFKKTPLQEINLAECIHLTADSLTSLAKIPTLLYLNLSGCYRISNQDVDNILGHLMPSLNVVYPHSNIPVLQKNERVETPLHIAVSWSDHQHIRDILASPLISDPTELLEQRDQNGDTALLIAAKFDDAVAMEILINAGANINTCNIREETALSICPGIENSKCLPLILNAGANVNIRDKEGKKPLFKALYHCLNNFRTLLAAGSDPNVYSATTFSRISFGPLITYAIVRNKSEFIQLLLHSPVIKLTNESLQIGLLCAAQHGQAQFIDQLIAAGAKIDGSEENLPSPLYQAASYLRTECMQHFVRLGANIEKPYQNMTPLMCAAEYGHEEGIKILLDAGANINAQNTQGETALMFASKYGEQACKQLLLDRGADVNLMDAEGRTLAARESR